MSDLTITADKTPWYQWDTGLTVTVSGGEMTECHFANRKQGTAYVQAVIKGKAKVPDELLQVAAPITAYGYIPDGAGGQTYIEQVFDVIARNIPADYTYTKTAQKTIRDAEQARDQAFAAVDHVHDVADQVVGFKNDAKASADAAKKSADSAEYQKGEAKKYADDAGVAFANAQSEAKMSSTHATESKNSAAKSEASATKAAQSASEASASASNAATSAQEAKVAAGNAASEVLAATKANADAAAKSATDAATAKAGAETAASNAATSASAAADSAAAAAKSADDAAASVDAINIIAPKIAAKDEDAPTVAYRKSLSVGAGSKCLADNHNQVAVGLAATAESGISTAFGIFAKSKNDAAIAMGMDVYADNTPSIASGVYALAIGKYSSSFGTNSQVIGGNAIALGASRAIGGNSVSVGSGAGADPGFSVAIGSFSRVTGDSAPDQNVETYNMKNLASVALGCYSTTNEKNVVSVGNDDTEINIYSRKVDSEGVTKPDAPFWVTNKITIPKVLQRLKRRITNVADPIDWHNAANRHYVDTTTSNALTATVTDTLVTVDDAVTQAPLSLSFKGVARQDGTPSVDNPVEVQVVTQPVVTVAGKNLQRYPFPYKHAKTETINGLTFIDNGDGSISVSGTPTAITFYNLDFTSDAEFLRNVEVKASMGGIDYFVECFTANNTVYPITSNKLAAKAFPSDTKMIRNYVYTDKQADATLYPQFERGKTATAYEPYSGQTVAITLPEEHPYLASLPNGTADEVIIDAYGNVNLVARVQKADVSNLGAANETTLLSNGRTRYQYYNAIDVPAKNDSVAFSPSFASVLDFTFPSQGMYVSGRNVLVGATSDPTEALKAGGYLYTTMGEVKTYNLGKVSLPSLKAGISNVWIDGGMGGTVTMTYKQDANKVIAGLKSQIAALTSKTASDEASTGEPTIESDPDYSTGEPTIE